MNDLLLLNLLSPITLAFALGVFAKAIRSEFSMPKELYQSLSIYLLFAIGLKGGVELSHASFQSIAAPAVVTLFLGCLTPLTTYFVLRRFGRFSIADSAGIAAHYGSVSAVTFIAAQQFTAALGNPAEGYMPTLLTLLESPGIHIALALGVVQLSGSPAHPKSAHNWKESLRDVLAGRTMILLVGGLLIGATMGERGWTQVSPFFETGFKGALTLFLLEMGLLAGERLGDLKKVGPFLIAFGIVMPVFHGGLGVLLGTWAGLSIGGCTVLAAMAASASYIAAPPAVRMTIPEANPTLYLTLALVITFPFNILLGIPLYYQFAKWIA